MCRTAKWDRDLEGFGLLVSYFEMVWFSFVIVMAQLDIMNKL